jgi:hypothetical protein
MAKINDMKEYEMTIIIRNDLLFFSRAVSKIRSYDDFVPYYHQFIGQMANLLGKLPIYPNIKVIFFSSSEVSKGDEIMPTIKTLKLLAHGDNYPSTQLKRVSSLNTRTNSLEKPFTQSKSLRIHSSRLNENKIKELHIDSEQPATGTDDGDS